MAYRLEFEGAAYTWDEYLDYYGDEAVASRLWTYRFLRLPLPGDVVQPADAAAHELNATWRWSSRRALDGQIYTFSEYIDYYGEEVAAHLWATPEYPPVQFVVEESDSYVSSDYSLTDASTGVGDGTARSSMDFDVGSDE